MTAPTLPGAGRAPQLEPREKVQGDQLSASSSASDSNGNLWVDGL